MAKIYMLNTVYVNLWDYTENLIYKYDLNW